MHFQYFAIVRKGPQQHLHGNNLFKSKNELCTVVRNTNDIQRTPKPTKRHSQEGHVPYRTKHSDPCIVDERRRRVRGDRLLIEPEPMAYFKTHIVGGIRTCNL